MRRAVFFVLALLPALAFAQDHRWELTPTVGYRWGGTVSLYAAAYDPEPRLYEVDLEKGGEVGLRLGLLVSRSFELELMYSRHFSELKDQDGLFGEEPGSTTPPGATETLSTDVATWQLGLVWHLLSGDTRPYLVLAAGQSSISSDTPLPDETATTYGLGVGVKVDMSSRLGMLFELRYNRSDTDADNTVLVEWEHRDCVGTCRYTYGYDADFDQVSLVAGLMIKF